MVEVPPDWPARLASEQDEHRRTRERLEMLSAASFEGLFIHIDGVIIDVNARLLEMSGYTRDEALAPDFMRRCVAPEDLPEVLRRIVNRVEGEYVITGVRRDGSRFLAELFSKQGALGERPVRVVSIRDVTERERTNILLRESEARFRELAAAAFDYTVFSRDGVVVEAHGDVERVIGRSARDMVGRKILDFIAPSGQPLVTDMLRLNKVGAYETAGLLPDGETVPVHIVVAASTLDGQSVRVAGVRDLRAAKRLEAERRALEQQVERAQRLDSLGVLAGGIAHDFNNLLAGILGNAELLTENATGEDRESVGAIITAAQRAAALTRQMLAYAGQRDLGRREPVDLGAVVHELRTLLDATLSKKAKLTLTIEPRSVVLGDRATIGQVLMNLLTNASDALGDAPGEIHVRATHVREVDARWDAAQGATVGPGAWVLVEVRDSGVGMDETTRGRVFEPFFTTKEQGHGLGLAACLGIVTAHGGAVLVESELGRGTCFSILLPATELAVLVAEESVRPRAPATPCRVLVVDDEALVRTQLRRSLELRGYTVEEASDGRAALARLLGSGTQPDVVVLDLTMPDVDGAEVLLRVRAAGSRVPVVISSGYLDVSIERRLPRGEFQGFLAKPYGSTELVTAIERARAAR